MPLHLRCRYILHSMHYNATLWPTTSPESSICICSTIKQGYLIHSTNFHVSRLMFCYNLTYIHYKFVIIHYKFIIIHLSESVPPMNSDESGRKWKSICEGGVTTP